MAGQSSETSRLKLKDNLREWSSHRNRETTRWRRYGHQVLEVAPIPVAGGSNGAVICRYLVRHSSMPAVPGTKAAIQMRQPGR